MKDILSAITAHNWTEHPLAERSGLPQSATSSWLSQEYGSCYSILGKICIAFGITLSQLFAEEYTPVSLTDSQRKLLER